MTDALDQLNQIIPPRGEPDKTSLLQLDAIIPPRAVTTPTQDLIQPIPDETLGERMQREIGETVVGPGILQADLIERGISPNDPQRSSLQQAVSSEGEMVAAGSMLGTAMGAPAGPVGMAVGGMAGAVAGELAFQTVEDLGRIEDVVDTETPPFSERITRAAKEGVIDLGFSVATKALVDLGVVGYKKLIPKETRELIEEADKLGVDPNKLVTTNSKVKDFYRSVVARFPFSSGAYRGRAKRAVSQLAEAKDMLFARMGPSWDLAKMGIKIDDSFGTQFKVFRNQINKMYANVLDEAGKTGAYVNTDKIKQTAIDQITSLRLALQAQGLSDDEVLKALTTDPSFKRLRQYTRMKDVLSVAEFRAMDDILDKDLAYAASRGGELTAQFGKVKDSFATAKDTVQQLQAPPEGGKSVKELWSEADQTFHKTMTEMFETPTAQKLERMVHKKMFKVGNYARSGTRNPDESFKLMWNAKSPKAMEDLHRVVGKQRFAAAARTHVEGIWKKSVQKGFDDFMRAPGQNKLAFDFNGWKRQLGLGDPKSAEYVTTKRTLDLAGAGVTMKDLEKYTALLETALRNSPESVNAFIARRAVLGGRPGLVSSFGMGAVGTIQSALTLALSAVGGTIISGKPIIQRMGLILDPNISMQHRKALMVSLNKMLEEQ